MSRATGWLGKLLFGWIAVGSLLYATWRIPRLPSVLHLIGEFPSWVVVAGASAWCIAMLALVAAGLMPQRTWAKPRVVMGSLGTSIVLVAFPMYLLSCGEGWEDDLGLAIGFVWTGCVLVAKIGFLVRARARRRHHQ
jgi:hypothetical protein